MRRYGSGSRFARALVMTCSGGMTLALLLATGALGQAPASPKADQKKDAAELAPLARFVPKQDLLVYAEFSGLETWGTAWKKTAAYKLLNQTSFGAMLEELTTQVADAALASKPEFRFSGRELVALLKHATRFGFALGVSGKPGTEPPVIAVVLRSARRGEARAVFNKLIGQFAGAGAKPEIIVKAGGREVSVVKSEHGPAWSWWAEKDDLVIGLGKPDSADVIIETLEGEKPSALDHPIRVELARAEGGFQPVGLAFVDLSMVPGLPPEATQLGLDGVKRIDYRWGFQDDALMSVIGIKAPAPRQGVLSLFDQPTFDRKSLPPLPAGLRDFTALSLDPAQLFDQIVGLAKAVNPGSQAQIEAALEGFKHATGEQLREDILSHLGPKMAMYIQPESKTIAASNPYTAMFIPILQIPKYTLVIELKNADAFGKSLDTLVTRANDSLRDVSRTTGSTQFAEFQALPSGSRGYVLNVPPSVLPLPTGLRPTVMLGKKYAVLTVSPEAARLALATENQRSGHWAPTGDLARVVERIPAGLMLLNLSDPRDTLFPELLANLPPLAQMIGSGAKTGKPFPASPGPEGFQLQIEPGMIPAPDELRKYLFPGWFVVSVDAEGVRMIARESFPNVNPATAGPMASPVMVALLLPAVQSAREAARRAQCTNNLKQIALAFHNYHSANDHFPPAAITDKDGKPLLSWRVAILPYIEQENLYNQFHRDEPWDSPHNKQLIQSMPQTYACPSGTAKDPSTTFYRVFVGKGAAFEGTEGQGIAEFTDGTSNTILGIEAPEAVPWTKPDDLKYDPDPDKPLPKYMGNRHPGGFNAVFCDGSVRFIKNSIDPKVLRALITRNGGEVISADSF